jgi:hypothetical protein
MVTAEFFEGIPPGLVARVFNGRPVLRIGNVDWIRLLESPAAYSLPGRDVKRELPDAVRSRDWMRGCLLGGYALEDFGD